MPCTAVVCTTELYDSFDNCPGWTARFGTRVVQGRSYLKFKGVLVSLVRVLCCFIRLVASLNVDCSIAYCHMLLAHLVATASFM